MPPRAIWKGAISFGMVAIPIKLYIATESKDFSFVTLHSTCNNRLRQKRYCPYHEMDVEQDEVVRGYQYAKDQYIVMDESDFEGLPVKSTHTIEISQFVELPSIDPIYFERSYTLEPDGVGLKPFYLLKQVLEKTGRVAIGKVSLRQKEHLCCLRPYGHGIVMETMYHSDEIRRTDELNLPEEEVTITSQELSMATSLVDQLTGAFEPEHYQDEYRVALERAIEEKLGTAQPVVASAPTPTGQVRDLMDALKASIEAAKQERSTLASPKQDSQSKKRARKAG